MNAAPTTPHTTRTRTPGRGRVCRPLALAAAALALLSPMLVREAPAQRSVTREYPARPNVRLHLKNRSGTITVEAWNSNKVKVTAEMESRGTRLTPEVSADHVSINVLRDNRDDVGDVNFRIRVPVNSTVDLETIRGNITVRGVEGEMVRAHVSSEGDIELTNIRAATVMAENTMGNILFDAELLRGGIYELRSMQGDISLRITADSGFRLTATAPRTRNINLGEFAGRGTFEFIGERRKVVGKVGDGGAAVNTTNLRGSIFFMPR